MVGKTLGHYKILEPLGKGVPRDGPESREFRGGIGGELG